MKTEKTCHRCGLLKSMEDYSLNAMYVDGHSGWCKPCHVAYGKEWAAKNKERRYAKACEWSRINIEKRRAARRKWQLKHHYARSPLDKLHDAIRTKLCRQLRSKKNRKSSFALIGFTIPELKQHLEKQFRDGMSWDNYGKWHIDHIRPKASFNIQSPEDPQFKECWSLFNLQPLWAKENLQKNAKWNAN